MSEGDPNGAKLANICGLHDLCANADGMLGRTGAEQYRHFSRAGAEQHRTSGRSEEHTSELQSLMRISYAVFCLKKQKHTNTTHDTNTCMNKDKKDITTYIQI